MSCQCGDGPRGRDDDDRRQDDQQVVAQVCLGKLVRCRAKVAEWQGEGDRPREEGNLQKGDRWGEGQGNWDGQQQHQRGERDPRR